MFIRAALLTDLSCLEEIDVGAYKEHDRHNVSRFQQILTHSDSHLYVIVDDKIVVGYIYFVSDKASAHIMSIAVRTSFGGKGCGRALMETLESISRTLELKSISLEVRATNKKAIIFYLHNDYEILGYIEDHYKDGEDAIYMEKEI